MKEELSDYEKEVFEKLSREELPSPSLEKRIISKLKSENLIITDTFQMNTYLKWAVSVAAAVLIFFSGHYLGKKSVEETIIDPNMGYMLIIKEDDNFKPGEPYEMFQEYSSWMENTFKKGVNITGQELKNEAVVVDSQKKLEYLDESTSDKVTGYFILEAPSLELALEVARDNPHLKYGGSIEVKEYMVR